MESQASSGGENTGASPHIIGRVAESSEGVVRDLVALPLRMLAGGLGIFEKLLRTTADAISESEPADDRVHDLERRMDSLEKQISSANGTPAD
jgi:hypothetical protein